MDYQAKSILNIVVVCLLVTACNIEAQTWTVRIDNNWDCEWRVITREQWDRLVEQKKVQNEYALLEFTDVLEHVEPARVIKGTRPQLRGYCYLLGAMLPRTDEARTLKKLTGYGGQILTYGNDQTGEFVMIFLNEYGSALPGAIRINSNEFTNRFNQCIRWVNGE